MLSAIIINNIINNWRSFPTYYLVVITTFFHSKLVIIVYSGCKPFHVLHPSDTFNNHPVTDNYGKKKIFTRPIR